MRVLIVGTGAIGGFYGALLARAGAEVAVVCRSDYEVVKSCGIRIQSPLGQWTFRPQAVYRRAGEVSVSPDYVVVCTKVLPQIDRAALIREAVGERTAIVLIQNGVEIENELAAAFPNRELISGLAFVCVSRTAPGQIRHQAYGGLKFGVFPSGISPRVEALCQAFERAGVKAEATSDIVAARWGKCVWNAAFNPLSVLSGGLTTDWLLTQEGLIRAVMAEVCAIAAALGHPLPEDVIEQNIASTRRMPPYQTSMLLDFEAGRPLETEAILGNAVRAAQRAGVSVPHLESLYALMKLRELAAQSRL
ncbi:2-dehydropantoate 2-reductase [Methylothermus subterraneus]